MENKIPSPFSNKKLVSPFKTDSQEIQEITNDINLIRDKYGLDEWVIVFSKKFDDGVFRWNSVGNKVSDFTLQMLKGALERAKDILGYEEEYEDEEDE